MAGLKAENPGPEKKGRTRRRNLFLGAGILIDAAKRRRIGGKSAGENLGRVIGQGDIIPPQIIGRRFGRAGRRLRFGRERIDDRVALAHHKVQMGERGVAGQTDKTQMGAGFHVLALAHGNAAFLQMAILRRPAVPMIDDDAIAAFPPLDGRTVDGADIHILNPVPGALDGAAGRRQDRHALRHGGAVKNAKIRTLMGVIATGPAAIVQGRITAHMDVVLDHAIPVGGTGERKSKLNGLGRKAVDGETH